jgi:uncharacterized protein YybS (DUF2232 family)
VSYSVQLEVTKGIATGILITLSVFTISIMMPIVGFFSSILIPLPILFYRIKIGRIPSLVIPFGTLLLIVVVLNNASIDLLFFVELMFLGFVIGELFEKQLSVDKTVAFSCGIVVGTGLIGLIIYGNMKGAGIVELISAYVARNLELTLALYRGMGVSEENITLISESLPQIEYVLVRILPALTIASTLFVSWSVILMSRPLLRLKALTYPDFGSLNQWRAPDILIWTVIGSGLMILLPDKSFKLVGINGLLIMLTVYFFQGIAIVAFFFEKKNFPRFLRIILYAMIGLQQILLLVVIGLGLFDLWLNFRKLNFNKGQEK